MINIKKANIHFYYMYKEERCPVLTIDFIDNKINILFKGTILTLDVPFEKLEKNV